MEKIVGLGAGGHAKVIVDLLRAAGSFQIVGLLDPNRELHGQTVLGVPVLGGEDRLESLFQEGVRHAFIGVGSNPENSIREAIYNRVRARGYSVPSLVHPSAVVSPSARLGGGVTVLAQSAINADAAIGENVLINTGSIVEHDCVLEDHVHLASGAKLAGGVHIGKGAFVGAGATVVPGIRIGRGAIVGAGAVVVDDVSDQATVVGVPAKPRRSLASSWQ